MKILSLPGVPPPTPRVACVADVLRRETLPGRASVLDVSAGSGLLAITAAKRGARSVTAVDARHGAVLTLRLNARLNDVRIRAERAGAEAALAGRRFDVLVSASDDPELIDHLAATAAEHLRPSGFVLLAPCAGPAARSVLDVLRETGLDADIATSPSDIDASRHGAVVVRARMPAKRPAYAVVSAGAG